MSAFELHRIAEHSPGETWYASIPCGRFSGLLWVSRAAASEAWFFRSELQDINFESWGESSPGTPFDSRDAAVSAGEASLKELADGIAERLAVDERTGARPT
jgi:hypothetical protein